MSPHQKESAQRFARWAVDYRTLYGVALLMATVTSVLLGISLASERANTDRIVSTRTEDFRDRAQKLEVDKAALTATTTAQAASIARLERIIRSLGVDPGPRETASPFPNPTPAPAPTTGGTRSAPSNGAPSPTPSPQRSPSQPSRPTPQPSATPSSGPDGIGNTSLCDLLIVVC